MARKAAQADPKTFHMTKQDRIELFAMHFLAQGAKGVAQVSYQTALQTEQNFKNKLNEVRASLGITESDGLAIDLEAGTISLGGGSHESVHK